MKSVVYLIAVLALCCLAAVEQDDVRPWGELERRLDDEVDHRYEDDVQQVRSPPTNAPDTRPGRCADAQHVDLPIHAHGGRAKTLDNSQFHHAGRA